MKIAVLFFALIAGASAFGVAPRFSSRHNTALAKSTTDKDMSADQLEIKQIAEKWSQVRFMDRAEADKLEPEWKEAYDRFHEKYEKDMENMQEIASKVKKMIEPDQVKKKTKGQRKRDKWTKKQALEAARGGKS